MGRRSNFERLPRDFYPTPLKAVEPLIPHLPQTDFSYWEPCAGNGALIDHLAELTGGLSHCSRETDLEPQRQDIAREDVFGPGFRLGERRFPPDLIITNPPWSRKVLHPMIEMFAEIAPTWLLFDANWMFTKQAAAHLPRLRKVVTIGRVKWIEDSKSVGKEDACWYLFDKKGDQPPAFFGRS